MSTYVLVHDAWHAGQIWDRITPLLEAAGHDCHAPSLTGHGTRSHLLGPDIGLRAHVADITTLIESEQLEDVILVGHGYAGLIIEGVADRIPERISHLVYLDAMIPADGESAADIDAPTRRRLVQAEQTSESWRIDPDAPTAGGWFGITDPINISWMQTFVGAESALCFQQPVRIRDPRTFRIPRSHIDCLQGPSPQAARRPLPALQPNGDPAVVWQLDAGHDCMVTTPDALSQLLIRFATDMT